MSDAPKSYVLLGKAKHHSMEVLATAREMGDILSDAVPFRSKEGWRSMFVLEVSLSAGLGPGAILYKIQVTYTANALRISPSGEEAQV